MSAICFAVKPSSTASELGVKVPQLSYYLGCLSEVRQGGSAGLQQWHQEQAGWTDDCLA